MSGRVGSITTGIIEDGLVLNVDAANRTSYPAQRTFAIAESGSCYNTLNLSISGSFISDPQFITQPISASCWTFDGVDDYIPFTISSELDFTSQNEITVSGWVKGIQSDLKCIASMWQPGPNKMWALYHDRITIYLGSNIILHRTQASSTNWEQIVFTYSKSEGKLKYYVDAVSIETSNSNDLSYNSVSPLTIGSLTDNVLQLFLGDIANIHIYNRALSSTEVLHNYNALKGRFS